MDSQVTVSCQKPLTAKISHNDIVERTKEDKDSPDVTLSEDGGSTMKPVNSMKILGIYFKRRLTFETHLN